MRSPMEKQGITISILFILTILIVALLYTIPLPVLAGPPYLAHSQWDSGTAEFCVYEATLTKYVEPRPAKVKMIMVKEQFDSAKLVKTSTAEDSFEVIKFHTIQAIPTGIYDYFQTASIFFDRTTGRVVKYTMGSQEGCGNTFMERHILLQQIANTVLGTCIHLQLRMVETHVTGLTGLWLLRFFNGE